MANVKMVMPIIAKQKWDMVSDDGQQVKGAKIFAFDEMVTTENKEGVFPTAFNISFNEYNNFPVVPAKYELELSMKAGSKGQFTVIGAKQVGEYKLS